MLNSKLNYYKSELQSNLTKQLLKTAFDLPPTSINLRVIIKSAVSVRVPSRDPRRLNFLPCSNESSTARCGFTWPLNFKKLPKNAVHLFLKRNPSTNQSSKSPRNYEYYFLCVCILVLRDIECTGKWYASLIYRFCGFWDAANIQSIIPSFRCSNNAKYDKI